MDVGKPWCRVVSQNPGSYCSQAEAEEVCPLRDPWVEVAAGHGLPYSTKAGATTCRVVCDLDKLLLVPP